MNQKDKIVKKHLDAMKAELEAIGYNPTEILIGFSDKNGSGPSAMEGRAYMLINMSLNIIKDLTATDTDAEKADLAKLITEKVLGLEAKIFKIPEFENKSTLQ